jgi:hypothetical protein
MPSPILQDHHLNAQDVADHDVIRLVTQQLGFNIDSACSAQPSLHKSGVWSSVPYWSSGKMCSGLISVRLQFGGHRVRGRSSPRTNSVRYRGKQ